jgi:hypothetical protein
LKKTILGLSLALVLLFSFQSSFGYTVTYEKWGPKIKDVSTVCILESDYLNSEILTESFSKRLMDETRISISEWEVQLKNFERGRDKSMWDINQIPVSLEQQKDFDYDQCHIFIKFKEKPDSQDEWYKLLGKTVYELGDTGRSDITIYYDNIKFCKTEDKDWIYFDPCYEAKPRLMQQIQSVVKHEFGHALGLGHFKADKLDVSIAWARGTITAPSIMAVFSHQNLNENVITPKDIVAVRSIYGENGFLPDDEKIITFDSFESSSDLFVIPKGELAVASVEGVINKDRYLSGIQVDITSIDPNHLVQNRKVRVNSDGGFSFDTILNDNTVNGTYTIFATYRNEKSPEILVEVQPEITEFKKGIPNWVKNTVGWWAEDQIDEYQFILGIQHLILIGVLNPTSSENLKVDNLEENISFGVKIPKYVKQTSLWWVEGKISEQEYVDCLQYLLKKEYIVI